MDTALSVVMPANDPMGVDRALAAGPDVHARRQFQRTPLHEAAFLGNVSSARRLVADGAG